MISEPVVPELVREVVGGAPYEYYPLGEFVVIAPGVCCGRPTFKYMRLEVSGVLALLSEGWSIAKVAAEFEQSNLRKSAMCEAIRSASEYLQLHSISPTTVLANRRRS